MEIFGFKTGKATTLSNNLLDYTISLFENTNVKFFDLNEFYKIEVFSDKQNNELITTDLIIVAIDETSDLKRVNEFYVTYLFKKNIFLLFVGNNNIVSNQLKEAQLYLNKNGNKLIDTFSVTNKKETFKNGQLNDFKLRIALINKVNQLKKNQFKQHYKNDSFTCGINRSQNDIGDASEY